MCKYIVALAVTVLLLSHLLLLTLLPSVICLSHGNVSVVKSNVSRHAKYLLALRGNYRCNVGFGGKAILRMRFHDLLFSQEVYCDYVGGPWGKSKLVVVKYAPLKNVEVFSLFKYISSHSNARYVVSKAEGVHQGKGLLHVERYDLFYLRASSGRFELVKGNGWGLSYRRVDPIKPIIEAYAFPQHYPMYGENYVRIISCSVKLVDFTRYIKIEVVDDNGSPLKSIVVGTLSNIVDNDGDGKGETSVQMRHGTKVFFVWRGGYEMTVRPWIFVEGVQYELYDVQAIAGLRLTQLSARRYRLKVMDDGVLRIIYRAKLEPPSPPPTPPPPPPPPEPRRVPRKHILHVRSNPKGISIKCYSEIFDVPFVFKRTPFDLINKSPFDVTLVAPMQHGNLRFLYWIVDGKRINGRTLNLRVVGEMTAMAIYGRKPSKGKYASILQVVSYPVSSVKVKVCSSTFHDKGWLIYWRTYTTPFEIVKKGSITNFRARLKVPLRVEQEGVPYRFSGYELRVLKGRVYQRDEGVSGDFKVLYYSLLHNSHALIILKYEPIKVTKKYEEKQGLPIFPGSIIPLKIDVVRLSEGLIKPGDHVALRIFSPLKWIRLFNLSMGSSLVESSMAASELHLIVPEDGVIKLPSESLDHGLVALLYGPGLYEKALHDWIAMRDRITYMLINITSYADAMCSLLINVTLLIGELDVERFIYEYRMGEVSIGFKLSFKFQGRYYNLSDFSKLYDYAWLIGRIAVWRNDISSYKAMNEEFICQANLSWSSLEEYVREQASCPASITFVKLLRLKGHTLLPLGYHFKVSGIVTRGYLVVSDFDMVKGDIIRMKVFFIGEYDHATPHIGASVLLVSNGTIHGIIKDEYDGTMDGLIHVDIPTRGYELLPIPGTPIEAKRKLIITIPYWWLSESSS